MQLYLDINRTNTDQKDQLIQVENAVRSLLQSNHLIYITQLLT
jgi:positive regulator of sigma E activity